MEQQISQVPRAVDVVDPRVRRSRQMLHQALESLLQSKAFEKISVGEISERATLNRATFYDHYADKFALLEGLVSTRFQELLDKRSVMFDGRCPGTLMGITLAMCDYLSGLPGVDCPQQRHLEQHFEAALMNIVRRMLLEGFSKMPPKSAALPAEVIAASVSGALYGAVSQWVRTPQRPPVEETVKAIFALISPLLPVAA